MNLPNRPSFRLDGKRALITGASRGIGLGGAVALAEAGAEVVLVARNRQNVESATQQLQQAGYKASWRGVDISQIENIAPMIDDLLDEFGNFDILFNNAGTNSPLPFLEVSPSNFDEIANLNFRAAFFVSQAVAKSMVQANKGGSIIHTSSQMGHVGGIERSVYCGTKFAIEGITKASALELAQYNIRVNAIAPTFIKTPMTQSSFDNPERLKWIKEKIKLGRVGEIEDIMGAVVFLASDASSLITGTSIVIDGGWTAD